jgi:hypothetical protein
MSNSTNTVLYFNEKGDIAHNLYDAGWLFYLSQPNRWDINKFYTKILPTHA